MNIIDTMSHNRIVKKAIFIAKRNWILSIDEGAENIRVYTPELKIT